MTRSHRCLLAFLAAGGALWGSVAAAQSPFALGVDLGTPGIGAEFSYMATPHFVLRLDGDWFTYKGTVKGAVLDYKGDLKLQTGGLFGDLHPFTSGFGAPFLVSAGAYFGTRGAGVQPGLHAEPVVIGGQSFTLGEVGVLQGKVKLDQFAPFAGIGWNNTFNNRHIGFKVMVGAAYGEQPKVELTRTGGAPLPPEVAQRLQAAIDVEEGRISDRLDVLRFYPVVQLGLAYRF